MARLNYDFDEEEWMERCDMFQRPGESSALRRATTSNPRNLPCSTCGEPDMLTPQDAALGYQCDYCADKAEGGRFE